MNNLLLVGAGQIGSRHLQALANIKVPFKLTVVDPDQSSLDRAKTRLLEVSSSCSNISFTKRLMDAELFDLAFIATNADIRLAVFRDILTNSKVNNVIFEKVLFQSNTQIQECTALLNRFSIHAWVNCPRRVFPSYKALRTTLDNEDFLSMSVTGSNFGLACNGIHFVDLFAFLSRQTEFTFKSELDSSLIESKRLGCYEAFGTLDGEIGNQRLKISCDNISDKITLEIKIETSSRHYIINEITQEISVYNLEGELLSTTKFSILPQSQLSHIYATDILTTGKCELTSFSESATLHRKYLSVLLAHFNSIKSDRFEVCPIS